MYVELDHALEPGMIEDINKPIPRTEWFKTTKYKVMEKNVIDIMAEIVVEKVEKVEKDKEKRERFEAISKRRAGGNYAAGKKEGVKLHNWCKFTPITPIYTNCVNFDIMDDKGFEAILGSDKKVFYDCDFGFFGAVLACYNNHWVLKTSPDDWWNVIVRNVAQAIDDKGDAEEIRRFFVAHEGKKTIHIEVPSPLNNLDYSWLFDQFSNGIRDNIKTPGYVDIMKADFSTTTPDQLISTEIMLMASLQKYFDYSFGITLCGIPGVEMKGTFQDWERLLEKTTKLEEVLQIIMTELKLGKWFTTTKETLGKLLDTYKGKPDQEWWSHILNWNEGYGSGPRSSWSGWMIDFLMAGKAESPQDFQSGVVSVPVKIIDEPIEDTGKLVAGTVGYTVEKKEGERAPVVEAVQGWALLLPPGSPITPRLK